MGEYARDAQGREVKIGTCEDMYYLRWDQRFSVAPMRGNVDPVKDAPELRFRFPWPDEDRIAPGCFDDYHRAISIPGTTCGPDHHGTVQFVAQAGYVVSLPCPESESLPEPFGLVAYGQPAPKRDILIHRNGWRGRALLVQQRFVTAVGLVPVLMCGGCGAKYRVEDRAEIEALAVACRSQGDARDQEERIAREFHDRRERAEGKEPTAWAPMPGVFWHAIADRILAGLGAQVLVR